MNVTYDYRNKIVLVTGGGSGIGLASSRAFAAAGALVVVADLSADNGNHAVEGIRAAGGKAEFRRVDVANEEEVVALIDYIRRTRGWMSPITMRESKRANAAGGGAVDNWRKVIDVNLSSVFYCLKAEIPVMVAQGGGAIVNTASIAGDRRQPSVYGRQARRGWPHESGGDGLSALEA